ncbi:MAG: hypothetical protein CVU38_07820 [Chloroflexi bacterium HGW-Chloroflexi-1]|nr:MAG: hypothetical protein CVU38_07820 [Chloroflexi bacterium HGW-Chloroflexi-1]
MSVKSSVPRDIALKLCADIRQEGRRKWFSVAAGQCWGCAKFSKGDPAKMCGGVVSCNLVLARYTERK